MALIRGNSASKNAQQSPGVSLCHYEGTDLQLAEGGVPIAGPWQMWTFSGAQLFFNLPDLAGAGIVGDEVYLAALVANAPAGDPAFQFSLIPIDTIDVSVAAAQQFCYTFTLGNVVRQRYQAAATIGDAPVALTTTPQIALAQNVTFLLRGTYGAGVVTFDVNSTIIAKS